jgi:hypothetical protein
VNRFLERIDFERKVLKLINNKFKTNELVGLTQLAIHRWAQNVVGFDDVLNGLLDLSANVSLLNERSGERFTVEYELNSRECEAKLTSLTIMLDELK